MTSDLATLYQRPLELLQHLVRFDTTNPPGDERACIEFIDSIFKASGFETQSHARVPERPNLIARLPGRGEAPPLLLYGHLDVVTTEGQNWMHPPFGAEVVDGWLYGRGALDMKGPVAIMLTAFLRAKAEGLVPAGDVIFAALSDEEAGGDFGAKFLVEQHPHLFDGVRYALGEFGGFSMEIGGRPFFPVMVAEKQICWMKLTVRGQGGHGSMPVRGGAMAKLGEALKRLDSQPLPIHVVPATRVFFEGLAEGSSGLMRQLFKGLLNPSLADRILNIMGERGRVFNPLLRNTVSATILHASDKINVIPSEISVEVDGRLLPGYKPEDLIREVQQVVGSGVEVELIRHDAGPAEPDLGLFPLLSEILNESEPDGKPVPLILSGVTDARFFSQLGIQTYGFTPMRLPADFSFTGAAHGADERIPVDAVEFGSEAVYKVIQRFK